MKKVKPEARQVRLTKDYISVFSSPEGKRVLFHLMQTHGILGTCFVEKDSHQSAFKEGERNVVLRLLAILKQDPMKIQERIEENMKETEYE